MPDAIGVTWLGHSTVVVDVAGSRILTDPLLRKHVPPLRRRGATAPDGHAWSGADAVLVSHLHHDHADLKSLRLLPGIPVYAAADNAGWLRRKGLDGVALRVGEWTPVGEGRAEVTPVRAIHHARPMPHRPNAAIGHLLRTPSGRVWVAGDTSLYDEMSELPLLAGGPIDLAVVPVGGWGARLSAGHMGPLEAAEACALVGARNALAVHWGTLYAPWLPTDVPRGWMDRPGPAFDAALRVSAPSCRLLWLVPGGSTVLAPESPGPGEAPA